MGSIDFAVPVHPTLRPAPRPDGVLELGRCSTPLQAEDIKKIRLGSKAMSEMSKKIKK